MYPIQNMNACVNFRKVIFRWIRSAIHFHVLGFVEMELLEFSYDRKKQTWFSKKIKVSFDLIGSGGRVLRKNSKFDLTCRDDLQIMNKLLGTTTRGIVVWNGVYHAIKVLRRRSKHWKHDVFTEITAQWNRAQGT